MAQANAFLLVDGDVCLCVFSLEGVMLAEAESCLQEVAALAGNHILHKAREGLRNGFDEYLHDWQTGSFLYTSNVHK